MAPLSDGLPLPSAQSMGFFEASLDTVESQLCDWLRETKSPRGMSFAARPVSGNLEEALRARLPLTMPAIERYLLVPTEGPWTAYLDNLRLGTDPSAIAYLSRRIGCRGVHFVARPGKGIILSVFGPRAASEGGNTLRDVRLFRDVDGWVFRETGQPLPFEDTDAYGAARIEERFKIEILERYLRELGIRAFEEDFYRPSAARLVEMAAAK